MRHVIPAFRISDAAIDSDDVKLMEAMGVKVELNTQVQDVQSLFAQGYTHIILATGAWNKGSAGLEYGQEMNVIEFLEQAKKAPAALQLGENVVVIGGGNTAMDAARAAKRIPGVKEGRPGLPPHQALHARRSRGAGAGSGRRRGVPGNGWPPSG